MGSDPFWGCVALSERWDYNDHTVRREYKEGSMKRLMMVVGIVLVSSTPAWASINSPLKDLPQDDDSSQGSSSRKALLRYSF